MNHDNAQPLSATLPQSGRAAEALLPHDDSCPDPRELTSGELLAVAGGPTIQNGSD